jgi:t-SNARE complex subunit (syntaxin)
VRNAETASGGMRNPSCVKAVRTTRKQKLRSIVIETTILEILIMTALFGWVGRNIA